MKNYFDQNLHYEKDQRSFKKRSSIPEPLKCSICFDVFHQPIRLFCCHTFCLQCIEGVLKASNKNCPICRQRINILKAGKDKIAEQFVNQLQVFCIYEKCSWSGELSLLKFHLQDECLFNQITEEKQKVQKTASFEFVDEEVEEKRNENISRGNLLSRAMKGMPNGINFNLAKKIITSDSNSFSNKPVERDINKMDEKEKKEKEKYESFDYLDELYNDVEL